MTAPQGSQTPVSSYLMGTMTFLILGAIAMLAGDFGGAYWNNYYAGVEGHIWIHAGTAAGLIIVPVALLMLYLVYWSAQAMREPRNITVSRLDTWFKVCLGIGTLYLVLGLIWVGYSIAEEYDDWWLDVGFYGGLIGGYGAAMFFYQAKRQAEQQGYPLGNATPPVTYPVTPPRPPGQ
jgi:hypothetical protein